jgi:hypothetical protein
MRNLYGDSVGSAVFAGFSFCGPSFAATAFPAITPPAIAPAVTPNALRRLIFSMMDSVIEEGTIAEISPDHTVGLCTSSHHPTTYRLILPPGKSVEAG